MMNEVINMQYSSLLDHDHVARVVAEALREDVGSGDVTTKVVSNNKWVKVDLYVREDAILCGESLFKQSFKQMGSAIEVDFFVHDGGVLQKNTRVAQVVGPAASILQAERVALNFLQMLSGTATLTQRYVQAIQSQGSQTRLLDTRKTIPGYRILQKYAVKCGGGDNHRIGLYDAFLIKENHIAACGSVTEAIKAARDHNCKLLLEVEVESMQELEEAVKAQPDRIMLDNFTQAQIKEAVRWVNGQIPLEVSGNITLENIGEYAQLGVDYISCGAVTKNISAIDFSMRVIE